MRAGQLILPQNPSGKPTAQTASVASPLALALAQKILSGGPVKNRQKPRPTPAKMLTLPLEIVALAVEWLAFENASYATVKTRLAALGFPIGGGSLPDFFTLKLMPVLLEEKSEQQESITLDLAPGQAARITITGRNLKLNLPDATAPNI